MKTTYIFYKQKIRGGGGGEELKDMFYMINSKQANTFLEVNIRYYMPTLYLDDILIRKSPPAYQDGVYEPAGQDRPNPFTISDIAHKGESGLGSVRNRTAMLVYFGKTFDLCYKALWKTTNFDFFLENFQSALPQALY